MKNTIGFMQGRLTPIKNGKIQEFPIKNWKNEFKAGKALNFKIMEWTLDSHKLYENPLMHSKGREQIKKIVKKNGYKIHSLVGDCFMNTPFWKKNKKESLKLKKDFINIMYASSKIGIKKIIVPLVDGGKIENKKQEKALIEFLNSITEILKFHNIQILFESDFPPNKYLKFIKKFNKDLFGINYDIGNSASKNFDPKEEIAAYGRYIKHVHVKDRMKRGKTVFLGSGNADFKTVFKKLKKIKYKGLFIIQGARAKDNNHALVLKKYRDFTIKHLKKSYL
jgi:L-ribulose-5-phosphate 3-epimerase